MPLLPAFRRQRQWISMGVKPAWPTLKVPGQTESHSETWSQNQSGKNEDQLNCGCVVNHTLNNSKPSTLKPDAGELT